MDKNELAQRIVNISKHLSDYTGGKLGNGFKSLKILTFRRTDKHSNISFMLFSENKHPKCVIKTPRHPVSEIARESINLEAEVLNKLAESKVKQFIPQIYGNHADNPTLMITEPIPGVELYTVILERENKDFFENIYGQINAFLLNLVTDQKHIYNDISTHFDKIIEKLEVVFPKNKKIKQIGKASLAELRNSSLPVTIQHNEFNPYNIILDKNSKICVIDWEDYIESGFPGFDHFDYLIVYMAELRITKNQAAKKEFFEVALNSINNYFEKLSIPQNIRNALFNLFILERTAFFVNEKRYEVNYARDWLSHLTEGDWQEIFYLKL